jgi:ABC-type branched-subunit amino acid transport system ATPase component/ABC-type branched-subunit amino acid transport system permease subunit
MVGTLAAITPQTFVDGTATGLTYGVLAVGLVLVYRSNRIINFAHVEIGAFAATLLGVLVLEYRWPYALALVVSLAAALVVGALVELTVVRRLFEAPRVVVLVATLGVAQILLAARAALPVPQVFEDYPTPFDGTWTSGSTVIRSAHLVAFLALPLLAIAIGWVVNRTYLGTTIRAAAANADATRLAGIDVKLVSTVVWSLAGLLAGAAAIVARPLQGGVTAAAGVTSLDASLLVVALTAAMVARMRSMALALLAGTALGVVQQMILVTRPTSGGLFDVVLLVLILGAALTGWLRSDDDRAAGRWSMSPRGRPVPERLQAIWLVRSSRRIVAVLALFAAAALPLVLTTSSQQLLWTEVAVFALLALSVTVLTGWGGQLSLGQFAFAGVGAFTAGALVQSRLAFPIAVPAAVAVTVVVALLVGAPALRIRGLVLAVATLAFAVVVQSYLLSQRLFLGDRTSAEIPRATWGPVDLTSQTVYYELVVVVLALAGLLAYRLRRTTLGRSLIAVRSNPSAASAYGVSPARTKLIAFAVGGGLAGLAGALYGGLLVRIEPSAISPERSLEVVAIAVIGGLTTVTGAFLGALWVVGLPALFGDSSQVALLTSGIGLLVLLMYFPAGLTQIVFDVRDLLYARLARALPPATGQKQPAQRSLPSARARAREARAAPESSGLSVRRLSVSFGSHVAVDGVSLEVAGPEIVGLIGANGAGKSTLMDAVGGFVRSEGEVLLDGHDVSAHSPTRRARRGLGRSFQDGALFADLTVREVVELGFGPGPVAREAVGWPSSARAARVRRSAADELVAFMGLGRYADAAIADLSTGTRRITELTCLLALEPRVLCLDEPTAGVAQREAEAFGPLLEEIRRELSCSMLVIEHDMPLIMSISTRVYCMSAGTLIAEGSPDEVRSAPAVIASYLGTDQRAIERSDHVPATAALP